MIGCVSHQRVGRGVSVVSGQLRLRVNVLVTCISIDWSVSIHTLRNGENLHSLSNSLSILPVNGIE